MPEFRALPLSVRFDPPSVIPADLLAIPIFEREDPSSAVEGLDEGARAEWIRAASTGELTGKAFEQVIVPSRAGGSSRILLVGAGPKEAFDADTMRRVAAASGLTARQRRAPRVALVLRGYEPGAEGEGGAARLAQAAAEGLTLAQLDTAFLKTGEPERPALTDVCLVVTEPEGRTRNRLCEAAELGRLLGECTNQARALGNEPANRLTPRAFAERAGALAEGTELRVEVLDEDHIRALGMGLLLGVAQGSAEPPRVVVLTHQPVGVTTGPVLGLVGKGITFDTGGISIKPADGMERMKVDMGGGAAVVAALRALALVKAPVRAIGVVPLTENMPGGRAMRPGDILTGAAGKTVEVINTDAEGRLVLADGLWLARERGATHLVDVATLTGACVIALGRGASGLFGAPDDWTARVRDAGTRAGERLWPMPLFEEYFEQMKSEAADMTNTGGRAAGAVTAALFLKQFAGDVPWAHLDIAGTAWVDEPKPWQARGATGVGVRTLTELALSFAA